MSFVTAKAMKSPAEKPLIATRLAEAREAAGLSQGELAERVGMTQTGIASIENGAVKRPKKLRELARAVARTEEWLLGEAEPSETATVTSISSRPNASFPPRYERFPDASIPLLGQTAAGPNGRFVLNGQPIGAVFCPPALIGVKDAYAVQVYGTSMEPKFEAGETVWLNPTAPVRAGDYVVAQIYSDEDDTLESYIKRFVSRSASVTRLYQFNPDEGESHDLAFDTNRVFSIHKIVFHAMV